MEGQFWMSFNQNIRGVSGSHWETTSSTNWNYYKNCNGLKCVGMLRMALPDQATSLFSGTQLALSVLLLALYTKFFVQMFDTMFDCRTRSRTFSDLNAWKTIEAKTKLYNGTGSLINANLVARLPKIRCLMSSDHCLIAKELTRV